MRNRFYLSALSLLLVGRIYAANTNSPALYLDVNLPVDQEALVKSVLAANPRTIVVQMSAGPLTVPWIAKKIPALLQAW